MDGREDGKGQEEAFGKSPLDEARRVGAHDSEEVADKGEIVLEGVEEEEGVEGGDSDWRVVAVATKGRVRIARAEKRKGRTHRV